MAALGLPYWTAAAAGAVAYAAVAGLLVYLTPRTAATRVFAVLLVARGLIGVTSTVAEEGAAEVAAFAAHLEGTFMVPYLVLVLAFGLLYPRPRPSAGWAIGAAGVVALAVAGMVALRPELVGTAAVADDGTLSLTTRGPITDLRPIWSGALAWPALLIAIEYVRGRTPGQTGSVLLVVVGLASYSAFTVTSYTLQWIVGTGLPPDTAIPLWSGGLANLPHMVLLLVLGGHALTSSDAASGRASQWAVLVLAACTALATLPLLVPEAMQALRALFRFPLPILVTYALLRHSLFDVDIKVKWTIRRGTVAGIFVAVFFVVSEIAQQFLTDEFGYVTGGLAAGALLFVIAPLQRVAERVADVALPGVAEPRVRGEAADEEAYRDAVRMALADGVVSRQEERALQRLAERLAIAVDRAWNLREEVEQELEMVSDAARAPEMV